MNETRSGGGAFRGCQASKDVSLGALKIAPYYFTRSV